MNKRLRSRCSQLNAQRCAGTSGNYIKMEHINACTAEAKMSGIVTRTINKSSSRGLVCGDLIERGSRQLEPKM